jgi:hypothetical protein
VIEMVVEDVVDNSPTAHEELGVEYPCESTFHRWQDWFRRSKGDIEGHLKSKAHTMLDLSVRILESGVSLLKSIRGMGDGWLRVMIRIIYNAGEFIPA